MKKSLLYFFLHLTFFVNAQVGINTNSPDPSAALDISSVTKGLLPPRMNNTSIRSIVNPADGLIVYCTDCTPKGLYVFTGTKWDSFSVDLPSGIDEPWQSNDVAVLFCAGQSNSIAALQLSPSDRISASTRLNNVFCLERLAHSSYSISDVTWTKLESETGQNRIGSGADVYQNSNYTHSSSVPNILGKLWQNQKAIDPSIPDLYIIHIAESSMGIDFINRVSSGSSIRTNGWSPEETRTNKASLYHLSRFLLRKAIKNLIASGKRPRIIGVDWNQWEMDFFTGANTGAYDPSLRYPKNLNNVVNGLSEALGNSEVSWFLHYPRAIPGSDGITYYNTLAAQTTINKIVQGNPRKFTLIDPQILLPSGTSIFQSDGVHYSSASYKSFAQFIFDRVFVNGLRGVVPNFSTSSIDPYELDGLIPRLNAVETNSTSTSTLSNFLTLSAPTSIFANKIVRGDNIGRTSIFGASFLASYTSDSDTKYTIGNDNSAGALGIKFTRIVSNNIAGFMTLDAVPATSKYGIIRVVMKGPCLIGGAFRVRPASGASWDGMGIKFISSVQGNFPSGTGVFPGQMGVYEGVDGSESGNWLQTLSNVSYPTNITVWRTWEFGFIPDNNGTFFTRYKDLLPTDAAFASTAWTTLNQTTGWETGSNASKFAAGGALEYGKIGLCYGIGANTPWASSVGLMRIREISFTSLD